jgi:lipooligosaccharide transport system ATP-binding protein
VIVAENLEKRFGDFVAVDGVSFSVYKGEVFGFLGPNGAGKTTTMKMIQCTSPKTGGRLEVLGMDVDTYQREIKRVLGVVPQETNLDPDFTVYQNLLVYSRYFNIPREEAERRARELIDFVQLGEKQDTVIDLLSGGMKRRLLLARALINRPEILILDEPTLGLDPQARHLLWDKIKSLKSQGVTIVLTTHYLDEAERLCDRLVIMDYGRILVEGRPSDIVREHIGTDIVEAENTPGVITCLEKHKARFDVTEERVQVYTEHPEEITSALLKECDFETITARRATLEDVFLKLTGKKLRE